jgi:8-oxo-dGTP diphosphatase
MQKVTAAVIQKEGEILLAKRKPGGHIGGKWEFPGGKTEPDESPEDALKREIKEELDIDIEVGELIGTITFSSEGNQGLRQFKLYFYLTTYKAGTVKALEHEKLAWVKPDAIMDYDLADSDKQLVPLIIKTLKKKSD